MVWKEHKTCDRCNVVKDIYSIFKYIKAASSCCKSVSVTMVKTDIRLRARCQAGFHIYEMNDVSQK